MKYLTEFRNQELASGLLKRIARRTLPKARIMEFCGGHTVTIFKHGLRQLLPPTIELVSGPGCPVCVTSTYDLDVVLEMSKIPDIILATFGDLFRVPASLGSLREQKALGGDIRIVYSPLDALNIARDNPSRPVVFLGIGFETTAPAVALSLLTAKKGSIRNYSVYSMHKLSPPILETILSSGTLDLQGLICPGHVSTITGGKVWEPLARKYEVPSVVAGFEPLDILLAVDMICAQLEEGTPRAEIAYSRGVTWEGNIRAQEAMEEVFEPAKANWRGVGWVPDSGLVIREELADFDATRLFPVAPPPSREPAGCICGDILRGAKAPSDCALFGTRCTPSDPVGPCMVSSEGSCSARYRYGGEVHG